MQQYDKFYPQQRVYRQPIFLLATQHTTFILATFLHENVTRDNLRTISDSFLASWHCRVIAIIVASAQL